jgi:hypothetical protein
MASCPSGGWGNFPFQGGLLLRIRGYFAGFIALLLRAD